MKQLYAAVLTPRIAPPPDCKLVVFASSINYTPEYDASKMLILARRYALHHKVFVVPERFAAGDFLCLCLISPEGEILGVQRACHLNLDYRGVFHRSDSIVPIKTPFGKVALLVDVDANKPQAVFSAVEKGAVLLIQSQFVQVFDFFEQRVTHSAQNAALSCGVSVVATVSKGGILVNSNGAVTSGFDENLPVFGAVSLKTTGSAQRQADANALFVAHQHSFTDQTGGTPT